MSAHRLSMSSWIKQTWTRVAMDFFESTISLSSVKLFFQNTKTVSLNSSCIKLHIEKWQKNVKLITHIPISDLSEVNCKQKKYVKCIWWQKIIRLKYWQFQVLAKVNDICCWIFSCYLLDGLQTLCWIKGLMKVSVNTPNIAIMTTSCRRTVKKTDVTNKDLEDIGSFS